jgi:hypothetical protein
VQLLFIHPPSLSAASVADGFSSTSLLKLKTAGRTTSLLNLKWKMHVLLLMIVSTSSSLYVYFIVWLLVCWFYPIVFVRVVT